MGPKCLPRPVSAGRKIQGNKSLLTLVFPIASLYLNMMSLLDFPLQYSCPGWLVVVGNFENVGGIDKVVIPPSHDMFSIDIEFEHWDLQNVRVDSQALAAQEISR